MTAVAEAEAPAESLGLGGMVAVVTAAGGGVGRRVAATLAAAGALVYCTDVLSPGAEATAALIVAGGGTALSRSVDVVERDEVDALVADVLAEAGRLDVMCNVANSVPTGRLVELDDSTVDQLVTTNVKGVLFGCQGAARAMVAQGGGSIVNLAVRQSADGASAVTEAAVVEITATLARELADGGVRVNAVVADAGLASGAASCALYLASEASAPVTGQCLRPGVPGRTRR